MNALTGRRSAWRRRAAPSSPPTASRPRPRPVGLLVVVALLVALGGCGVPAEGEATLHDPAEVPFGLLDPAPPTVVDSPPPNGATVVEVFLVQDDADLLVPVERAAAGGATLRGRMQALVRPLTTFESAAGLTTALPGPQVVTDVEESGGIAIVDLSEDFRAVDGADQPLAIAQIVYTLTSLPGIGRVSFTLEGEPIRVPRGDGALTGDSVARDAYAELLG